MAENKQHYETSSRMDRSSAETENTLTRMGISSSDLRSRFKGRVITADDEDYNPARAVFYGGIDKKPAVIIRVTEAEDIKNAIALAGETGMELAVRSGGHSAAGYGLSEGGIVIDLRDMRELKVDTENRTAWAETGLTAGEYTTAVDAHGLATGFGDTGTVGIGGLTLGGGVGYLSRKHGLTIDNLLAAEIVTADGQNRYLDTEHEPDLFWAVRGGGGNFGAATRFKFKLHEMGDVMGGMLILPATPEVITGFIREAEAAPDELSTIANIMPAPAMPFLPPELHGKLILLAMMTYAGKVDPGMKAVAPFRNLAKPLADMLRPLRYPEMFPPMEEGYHPTALGHTTFLDWVDHQTAEAIIEHLQASDAVMRVTQMRVLGGAVARVNNDATAYANRHRLIMTNLGVFYTGPEDKARQLEWITKFATDLRQGEPAAYVNFLSDEGGSRVRVAYPGKTWERLAKIKAQYDPTNLFHVNQNITPA